MIKRKSTLKYSPEAVSRVSFNKQIQKDPLKRAKLFAITDKVEIWHCTSIGDTRIARRIHR